MAQEDEISLYELGSINRIFDDDEDETVSYSSGSALRTKANSHLCKRSNKGDNVFRKGPAPLEDAKLKGDFEKSFKPGALNNSKSHGNGAQGNASSSGLLNYFEKLGHSPEGEIIDLEFIDSLLRVGADINVTDIYGQTIMHEVAREWSVGVAQACLERFADIDKADKYGRSPLHLACAVNYPEMIEWLVTNGGEQNCLYFISLLVSHYCFQFCPNESCCHSLLTLLGGAQFHESSKQNKARKTAIVT